MATYALVDPAEVIAFVGATGAYVTPNDPGDPSWWADIVAAALNGATETALARGEDWTSVVTAAGLAELRAAALIAAGDAYNRRSSPFGVTGGYDDQGAGIRVARDYLTAAEPMLARYRDVSAGIG